MMLMNDAAKHLDLDFVLSRVLVHTPYGEDEKRRLRVYLPEEQAQLSEELDRVEKAAELLGSHRYTVVEIRNQFKRVRNLTGTFNRLENGEVLSVTELFEIKTLVNVFDKLADLEASLPWQFPENLRVEKLAAVERLLDPEMTGTGTFYIYDAYSEVLGHIRQEIRRFEGLIQQERRGQKESLESSLGLKFRPGGDITVPKQDKELIERLGTVPELTYNSETYINITFKIRTTAAMDACDNQIERLKGQEEEEEYTIRKELSFTLKAWVDSLTRNTGAIGKLDVLLAKAALAVGFQGVKPEISEDGRLTIQAGRHLKVAHALSKEDKHFTPVSLDIRRGVTCITGANMGGKTVTLKLIGMLTLMAQMGFFVPAEKMIFTPRAFFFISVGDEQNTDKGLSTFGAEMQKIGRILQDSAQNGMILIDELARGTNPKEGFAISKAILNHLKSKPVISVVTTHFDGLADDEEILHLQVMGLSGIDFNTLRQELSEEGTLGIDAVHQLMDYRLRVIQGPEEVPKDAINISRLMGLDEGILEEAKRILES